jgi:lysozyme
MEQMSDYTLGIDVSKWNGAMNWQTAEDAGAKFAFIRAGSINKTSGVCYTDYRFEENSTEAPGHFPVGFYWYYRPQHDPEKQADYLSELIGDKDWKLPPVLDLEESGGLSAAAVTNSAASFALRVNENLSMLPLLYSRAYWLNDNTVPDDFMKMLKLWIARYTSKGKPWGNILPWPDSPKIKPRDYDDWLFWQWSADGNGRGAEFGGSSNSMDLNYFNGDQQAFDEFLLYLGAEPMKPKRIRVDYWRNCVMRDTPMGMSINIARVDEELKVIDSGVDEKGREWYQTSGGLWVPSWQVEEVPA